MKTHRLLPLIAVALGMALVVPVQAATVLMVIANSGSLTSEETTIKTQFQNWGYTVSTIWDNDTQANFNTAVAGADVAYIPSTIQEWELTTKLRTASIGVVCAERYEDVYMGFSTGQGWDYSATQMNITDNTHDITTGFSTGLLTICSSSATCALMNPTLASGFRVLATQNFGNNGLGVVDTGGALAQTTNGNSTATARRVRLCWGGDSFSITSLNSTGLTILQRALVWARGKSLVARWKLDETSGTSAADASGNANTGTVTGTATWTSAVLNNGFQFNGSTKIQASGMFSNPKNVSVAAWAKLTTADSGGSEIISLGDHFYLRLDEGGVAKAAMYTGSAWQTVTFSGTYAGTGWHHFAAAFDDDNNTFRLYIDGTLAASTSNTNSISYAGLGSNTVIGRNGNGATNNDFTGAIDEVRVYNYAISATEVAQLYGFIGHWKLDQTSGTTVTDYSPFGANGTLSGAANWSTDCGGMANFAFDGSTNYVSVTNASQLQPTDSITIAAWIKGNAWGSGTDNDVILRKGEGNPNNYALAISDGHVELLLDGNDASGIRSTTILSTGQWYHVAATWDGATVKIYINGVLDYSVARTGTIGTDTRPLYIGGRSGTDLFDGMIRDVRFYNRALDLTSIQKLAGLVGYWKFSEGSGTSAADSSGLGNTATLSGGAGWTSDCAGNNNALLTNGTGGIAQSTVPFTPPDVGTVAFWMRSTGAPAGVARIIGVGPDWEIRQQVDGTVVTDLCGDGNTTICTVTPLSEVGRWYHVAFTFDSANDTYAIYVDGKLERAGTSPNNLVQQPAALISFGTRTGATEYWSGALRDVRIYSRKLCPTEIAALYGLIGYWKFDETSGVTASDSSGIGNDGTYTSGPTLGASAPRNLGVYFPSDGKCVIVPASATLNAMGASDADFSTAFWVKPAGLNGGWRPLLHKGSVDTERGPGVWLNPGNNRVHFRLTTTANWNEGTDSVADLPTGGWSHIACVKAGNKWRCYINGALDTEYTLSANATGNNGPLYLGDDPWYGGSNCYMDDVRAYNRALCPAEVFALYGGASFPGVRVTKWIEIQ